MKSLKLNVCITSIINAVVFLRILLYTPFVYLFTLSSPSSISPVTHPKKHCVCTIRWHHRKGSFITIADYYGYIYYINILYIRNCEILVIKKHADASCDF